MKSLPFEFSTKWADLGTLLQEAARDDDQGKWNELMGILDDRDRQLEDFLSRQPIVFPRDPGVEVYRSMPWTAKAFGIIREWNVEVGQDDDGNDDLQDDDVTVELHVNGNMVATMTLPAGTAYVDYDGELPETEPGDRVTVYCEQTGFVIVSTVSF